MGLCSGPIKRTGRIPFCPCSLARRSVRYSHRCSNMPLERKHWTLLAIASANGASVSPVQLQKALFVLGRELPDLVGEGYYDFQPYNYGPFDSTVYEDAEALAEDGLVSINRPYRWSEYAATPEGMHLAASLRERASPSAAQFLSDLVSWARQLTFQDLVRAIYARYPDTRAKSIFEDPDA